MGDRWMRYTKRPFSKREYSVSTFSTTCLPKEQTFVEQVITMLSLLSKLKKKKKVWEWIWWMRSLHWILTDYWHHKMLRHRFAGWYWDRPRTSLRRRHSEGPFRIALWGRQLSVGTCRRFPLSRRIQGVNGMAALLYVQKDACGTKMKN